MRVLIVGAGGHAQVVADSLLRAQDAGSEQQPVGFVDDAAERAGTSVLGLPVFGRISTIPQIPHDALIIAIGDNKIRARLWETFSADGAQFANAIHPSAIIAPDVTLGSGIMISAGVIVNTGSTIGSNTILNTGSTIDHHNAIGTHVHIAPGCHLAGVVTVATGVFIGIGATVLPRQHIDSWATIGAAALVNRPIAARSTVVGIPAKPIN